MSSSPFSTTNTFCCGAVSAHEDHAYMHDLMIMGYGLTPFGTVLSYGCWLSSLTAGTLVDIWDHYSLLLHPTFSIRRPARPPREWPELRVSSMTTKLWPIFPFIHRANTGQVDAVRCPHESELAPCAAPRCWRSNGVLSNLEIGAATDARAQRSSRAVRNLARSD